jgi:hypothetical protein
LDINLLREELAIITDNINQQLCLVKELCEDYPDDNESSYYVEERTPLTFDLLYSPTLDGKVVNNVSSQNALQAILSRLQDRQDIFEELTKRVDRLEKQVFMPFICHTINASIELTSHLDRSTCGYYPRGPRQSDPSLHHCLDHLSSSFFRD